MSTVVCGSNVMWVFLYDFMSCIDRNMCLQATTQFSLGSVETETAEIDVSQWVVASARSDNIFVASVNETSGHIQGKSLNCPFF